MLLLKHCQDSKYKSKQVIKKVLDFTLNRRSKNKASVLIKMEILLSLVVFVIVFILCIDFKS